MPYGLSGKELGKVDKGNKLTSRFPHGFSPKQEASSIGLKSMEGQTRIVKNTFFLLAGNVIEQLISFILVVAIARYLGEGGLGEYAFVFSFVWIMVILMNPGLDYLLLKEISRDEIKTFQYASNMLIIKLVLGSMALVITMIITLLLPKGSDLKLCIGIASISFFINGFGSIFFQIIQARERMEFNAMVKIAERLIALGAGLLFLHRGFSLPWLVLSLFLSGVVRDILSYFFSRKVVELEYHFNLSTCKMLLKSLPIPSRSFGHPPLGYVPQQIWNIFCQRLSRGKGGFSHPFFPV